MCLSLLILFIFSCFSSFSFVLVYSAVGGSLTNVCSSVSLGSTTPSKNQTSRWTRSDKDLKGLPQRGQQSKVNRKVNKRVSQASNASSSDSPDSSNRNSLDNAIELNEQACTLVYLSTSECKRVLCASFVQYHLEPFCFHPSVFVFLNHHFRQGFVQQIELNN